jgi:CRP-like cAMP-binding protein
MGYQIHMWIDDFSIEPRVMSEFRSLVWYMSQRHDVPLPSPAFDLYTYDGLAATAASEMDTSELRTRLLASHLLDGLDDDEVDRLTSMSKPYRFAISEVISTELGAESILYTLWEGEARMDLIAPTGETRTIASLTPGDVFGLVHPPDESGFSLAVVAVTDCEVIGTDVDAAGSVIARNPSLLDALAQIRATRTRRISRTTAMLVTMTRGLPQEGEGTS